MADKGFTALGRLLAMLSRGWSVMPPVRAKGQVVQDPSDAERTTRIAHRRIHVERWVRRIKEWSFLSRPVPLLQKDLISDIVAVIALLGNLQPPLASTSDVEDSVSRWS